MPNWLSFLLLSYILIMIFLFYLLLYSDAAWIDELYKGKAEEAPTLSQGPGSPFSIHSVNQDDIWLELEKPGEACSSAPVADLPQGGGAPGQPAGEREPEAPTIDELISKMKLVLRGHRKLRSDVLKKIQEDIRLETASPHKRIKMNEYLDYVSNNRDSLLNSGQSLVYAFTVRVND